MISHRPLLPCFDRRPAGIFMIWPENSFPLAKEAGTYCLLYTTTEKQLPPDRRDTKEEKSK